MKKLIFILSIAIVAVACNKGDNVKVSPSIDEEFNHAGETYRWTTSAHAHNPSTDCRCEVKAPNGNWGTPWVNCEDFSTSSCN